MYAQLSLIISLHLFILPPKYHAQLDREKFYDSECEKTFNCGKNVTEIGYPFWGGDRPKYCGLEGLELSCLNEEDGGLAMLDIGFDKKFRVLYINININMSSYYEIKVKLRADDVSHDNCPQEFEISADFNEDLFDYLSDTEDLRMFYHCPPGIDASVLNSIQNNFTCTMSSWSKTAAFFGNETLLSQFPILHDCKIKVRVPVNRTVLEEFESTVKMELQVLLNPSFVVFYKINEAACSACANSDGLCWSSINSSAGLPCLCYPPTCPKSRAAVRNSQGKVELSL